MSKIRFVFSPEDSETLGEMIAPTQPERKKAQARRTRAYALLGLGLIVVLFILALAGSLLFESVGVAVD